MGWSVSAKGSPREAKQALSSQFSQVKVNCASIPAEVKTIENTEKTVNDALDFHTEQGTATVSVSGYGSACLRGAEWPGDFQVSVVVQIRSLAPSAPTS